MKGAADVKPTVKKAALASSTFLLVVGGCVVGWRLACSGEVLPPKQLVVYAWEDYLDTDILEEFTAQTGIAVRVETFATIDESLATLESHAQPFGLALVDEVAVEPLADSKIIRPFDRKRLPHAALVEPRFADPNGLGVAYLWGCTGFAFDKRHVPLETSSLSVLWDPRYAGRIALLDDAFEVLDVLFKRSGHPSNSTSPEALDDARRVAKSLAQNRIVLGDTFSNLDDLLAGKAWIAQAYSGDVLSKTKESKDIAFFLPVEGFNTWVDYLVLPSRSPMVAQAHALVDFLSRQEISVRSAARFHYDSPLRGAAAVLTRIQLDPRALLPSFERRMQGARFRSVGPLTGEYQKIFNELRRRLP